MASRELRMTGVVRGACPSGASAIFKRCTCMARFATTNCYTRAFNVKRMGRYLKIIVAATIGQRRNALHSMHCLRTFSPRREAGRLQERCCHSAEQAQARCNQGR